MDHSPSPRTVDTSVQAMDSNLQEIEKSTLKTSKSTSEMNSIVESVLNLEDQAFDDWQREEKAIGGNSLQAVNQKSQRVPFRLTSLIQVFVPAELSLAVQHLWEKMQTSEWDVMSNDKQAHKIHVWSNFLRLVLDTIPDNLRATKTALSPISRRYLMRLAFYKLNKATGGNNIHVATRGKTDQVQIIKSYYQAAFELGEKQVIPQSPSSKRGSALLRMAADGDVGLFSMFGGQGVEWLSEMRSLYFTYPETRSLIERGASILQEYAKHEVAKSYLRHGFDVISWIKNENSVKLPSQEYLFSAPVSYPMIGFTQMVQYFITVKTWDLPLESLVKLFKGSCGHSQGIVASVVASSSTTMEQLLNNICQAVSLLFWIGVRLQQASPIPSSVSRNDILQEVKQHDLTEPTPMLAIYHLLPEVVQTYVDTVNRSVSLSKEPEKQIEVALRNGRAAVIVVGHPESLHALAMLLYKAELPKSKGEDQSRIPYTKRKKEFTLKYLSVTVPFHSKHLLTKSLSFIASDVEAMKINFDAKQLQFPVYSTADGSDLRNSPNLIAELVRLQCVEHVNWIKATEPASLRNGVTHIIDFGPGETAGIGSLTARNIEGAGVQVILADAFKTSTSRLADKSVLFLENKDMIPFAVNWAAEYSPKIVKRKSDGKSMIYTKFTELLGKPPVMIAGMTPTTVNPHLVAACLNAGYHGELAAGGLPTEDMFRQTVDTLVNEMEAGNGITFNLLFLNQRLWGFQYPLIEKLRAEGYPIEGVTIAAGVPSVERSVEILQSLKSAGIKHVSFKPGSVKSIETVIHIARENPTVNVILQWTGGRGGGHHSFEDFHEPILQTYAQIRAQKNIVLVGGSGFGDAEESFPYLSGVWSVKFGFPPMPFDAILIASRVMVAKEAATALQAKELLVKTPGVANEREWEKSYESEAGGVITVLSELGEPIHKIFNRGLRVWREFDKEFFSLPLDKQEQKILEKKNMIIQRLNADFQKVYFGKKFDGTVCDLEEMTYPEVAHRMVELMYIPPRNTSKARWIHPDFLARVFEFALRIEERFASNTKQLSSIPPLTTLKENPQEWLKLLFNDSHYSQAQNQLLCSEDVDFFLQLCRQSGRKPVNFIPVIGKDLQFWFKKDSLWQSEDIEAVQDQDVGRVVILQGPVAVKHSVKVNEPLADILNGIHDGWLKILNDQKQRQEQTLEYVGGEVIPRGEIGLDVNIQALDKHTKLMTIDLTTIEKLPEPDAWTAFLAQGEKSWWNALLICDHIVQGKRWNENVIKNLFQPKLGQKFTLKYIDDRIVEVAIFDSLFAETATTSHATLQVLFNSQQNTFSVTINHWKPNVNKNYTLVPLELHFKYVPEQGTSPIHEIMENRNNRIKQFYSKLWFEKVDTKTPKLSPMDAVFEHTFTPTDSDIEAFCRAAGRPVIRTSDGHNKARFDFGIVSAWEPLISSLFLDTIDGDILSLVHLSNGFKRLCDDTDTVFVTSGKPVHSKMEIVEITNVAAGQKVTVQGVLSVDGKPTVQIRSQFLFRGHTQFKDLLTKSQDKRVVTLDKLESIAVLKSKKWIKWEEGVQLNIKDSLLFQLDMVEISKQGAKNKTFITSGQVMKITASTSSYEKLPVGVVIGHIQYRAEGVLGNKILAYLLRAGKPYEQAVFFSTGGYSLLSSPDKIRARDENQTYALASRDFNPIHTNHFFATLAQLPTTITHGMWTSANAFRVLELFAAKNDLQRILNFSTEFIGMVHPGDKLQTQLKHVGMKGGRNLVEIVTKKSTGETVLKGSAEVKSQKTAYIFTGQGSAEKGMGMDLYQSSAVAREIWDIADKYFLNTYGFSILNIVRNNVKEITIHFGGIKGEEIRKKYQKLTQQVQVREGKQTFTVERPLFPEINSGSSSYTFKHHEGLLIATQFSQPALVLVELAAFTDMKSKGLIPSDCFFAGHSLGEYAALASVASVISTESLVDIVFLRGMTMQNAVVRDKMGRSPYAMVAVNPGRVHPHKFREQQLNQVIQAIVEQNNELLQVVNYNIENYQYVVAGERGNLHTLGLVLTELKSDLTKANNLQKIIAAALLQTKEATDPDTGVVPLERGLATIPLPGIDVPFHSRYLKDGVPAFRQILEHRMHPDQLVPEALEGRYIPNVTAARFSLSKSYVEMIYNATQSDVLRTILENYDEMAKNKKLLGYKILIELLAYQFASPVRWIETQQLFFSELGIERLIEVGPAPTLMTMAQRTLQIAPDKYPLISREILWYGRDRSTIYFEHEDTNVVEDEQPPKEEPVAKPNVVVPPPSVPVAPAPIVQAAQVPDAHPTSVEFLKVLLSVKLKKPLSAIEDGANLKQLVGGKSALQNEIVGDLENEFQTKLADDAVDSPLSKLSVPTYKQLGKIGTGMVSKLLSNKMPGGFGPSQIKGYLAKKYGLGEGRIEGALLHGITMEPANRLATEAEAQTWLDSVVGSYASKVGVPIGAVAAHSVVPSAVSSVGVASVVVPIADEPVSALMALRVLLALKLKKSLDSITPNVAIKDLVGGKSALQNELLGDIQKEFGVEPDNAAEMDLNTLSSRVGRSYSKLGGYFNGLISKFISAKMPGGFSASSVKSYLAGKYGFGELRTEGVLLHSLTMEPPSRLTTEGDAKAYLDQVATKYADAAGVSLNSATSGSMQGAAQVVDSAAFTEFKILHEAYMQNQLASYFEFLGQDPLESERAIQLQHSLRQKLEKTLELFVKEHGEEYTDGIKPVFSSQKERRFNSSWNWIKQDLMILYYDYCCGRATNWNNDVRERLYHIKNRSIPLALELVEYYIKKAKEDGMPEITQFITLLLNTLAEVMNDEPRYRELKEPVGPETTIAENGSIHFKDIKRKSEKDMSQYVTEMEKGRRKPKEPESTKDEAVQKTLLLLQSQNVDPKVIELFTQAMKQNVPPKEDETPFLFLRSEDKKDPSNRVYDPELTQQYFEVLKKIAREGVCFTGKTVLITGCGKDSIGLELVKGLLRGGAKIYATTSHFSADGSKLYLSVYDNHGAKGSELVVLPFNQASTQDIQELVEYIYEKEKADLDYIIPFAALSEKGMDIGELEAKSELAHRIMLTNVVRLIGAIKNKKASLGIVCRPAHVLLPLSPNHGNFGNDGLYGESKLGLEALLNKWKSERWSDYLSLAGAIIGWTRGTGLMNANNIIAEALEKKLEVRTFSTREMAFNLVSLLHPEMVVLAQKGPLVADLNGGLHTVKDLNEVLTSLRASIYDEAALTRAVNLDTKLDKEVEQLEEVVEQKNITKKDNITIEFPELPSKEKLEQLASLKGMIDLEKVVVVAGFGEIGPYGNARTRWEMEAYGEFSLEGCIELAWMMGLIKYSKEHSSWVDAKSGKKIHSHEVKPLYEEFILKHTGIRVIEPELFGGYDPLNKSFLHQVALNHDITPIEVSAEEAKHFKQKHKDSVDTYEKDGTWFLKMKKGSVMYIPKALKFDRFVAGQIPTTWDPATLGIPQDIIQQVDRVTLFSLVSLVEALVSSGVVDPYEFYEYVHVSEVGNTVGGGFGGMDSIRDVHKARFMELPVQADMLQETFINTVPAWLNMLLLSSSGPIKTPVGACATAVESVEIGVDTLRSGKAKVVIVGGYDDFGEEGSYEFAQMKATSNAELEMAAGREPKEMSRPATSTRGGFMEAQGAGVQILMTADLAIKMGVPIYGIIELVSTATDKEGRSVPAPGQGILTTARESHKNGTSPLLDISFRKKHLERELKSIQRWKQEEVELLDEIIEARVTDQKLSKEEVTEFRAQQEHFLEQQVKKKIKAAYSVWGNEFYVQDPNIAPLRGALSVYGLTIDDVGLASFHGTGTKANDLNESKVLQKQFEHLGRSKGNPVISIFQKYLTGHPKGAAAAWMLNGLIQSMLSGVVPGNRNADNIDAELQQFDLIVFLNKSLNTYGFKAGLLKSFGFGQVGGEVLLIHPDYVLSQLSEKELLVYEEKRMRRQSASYRYIQNAITGKSSYVKVKDSPPYSALDEQKVYLDPLARASYNPQAKTWKFKSSRPSNNESNQPQSNLSNNNNAPVPTQAKSSHKRSMSNNALVNLEVTLREMGEGLRTTLDRGIGIDAQLISEIDDMWINNSDFFSRNFTNTEISYCRAAPDTSSSFAGRFAAKEAVIKAISSCDVDEKSRNLWKGSAAPLKDIEILQSSSGAPKVVLYGHAQEVATLLGINFIKVAISHSGEYAIAQAIAR